MLKDFEVEEPVVKATRDDSIEMTAERCPQRGRDANTGERRTGSRRSLSAVQEFADVSDGHVQVVTVDLSLREHLVSNYRPLSARELDVMGSPADVWLELSL